MKSYLVGRETLFTSVRLKMAAVGVVAVSSLALGLLSQVFIPLSFTPIPISFRLQAVLALACILPGRLAFYSTALFLVEGALGLPFFAVGTGAAGLVGPSGGYLLGYLAVSLLTPWIISKLPSKNLVPLVGVFTISTAVVYAIGSFWLSYFVGAKAAFALGVAPFILVDICKNIVLATLVKGFYLNKK